MKKKRIDFTASAFPGIINYQTDQTDPEDPTKTINYAKIYGKYPDVRLFQIDGNGDWLPSQQEPKFTLVAGTQKVNSIIWDLGVPTPCFIIIS